MEEKRNPRGAKRPHKEIKMIAGIGNPGEEYRFTYHNAGLLFLSFLEELSSAGAKQKTHSSKTFTYDKKDGLPILVTSLVFMNESGSAIQKAARFFRIPHESLLIVHDDADLPLGEYQLAFDRGSAGHNGIRSVIASLGTQSFWRLRIGIRGENPERGRQRAEDFVLKKISAEDLSALEYAFRSAIEKEPLLECFRVD